MSRFPIPALLGLSLLASSALAQSTEVENLSADEIFKQIIDNSKVDFRTATGGYLVRIRNAEREKHHDQKLEQMRKLLEDSTKERIEREKGMGIATNVEKLKQENETVLSEYQLKLSLGGTRTTAERYFMDGEKFRIERYFMDNERPLQELKQAIEAGELPLNDPNIIVWDGSAVSEIIRKDPRLVTESTEPPKVFSAISYEKFAAVPDFIMQGRNAKDPRLLENLRAAKMPVSASTLPAEKYGEDAIRFQIGIPGSIGMVGEVDVLPGKGYVMRHQVTRIAGAVINEDDFSDFVETSVGVWVPTHVKHDAFDFDENKVPQLKNGFERLAFEMPQTNVEIAASQFRLADDPVFKSAHPLGHGLPTPATPVSASPATSSYRTLLFAAVNILLLGFLIVWPRLRRHKSPSVRGP